MTVDLCGAFLGVSTILLGGSPHNGANRYLARTQHDERRLLED